MAARDWSVLGRRHDVTLYERNDYPGGHTHTVDVEAGGRVHAVDTGFIVFNTRTYPRINSYEQVQESKPWYTKTGRLEFYRPEPEFIEIS